MPRPLHTRGPTPLLLLASLAAVVAAVAAAGGGEAITQSNFQKVVEDSVVWVVEFQSGRCGTCQEFKPVWQQFVATVGGRAKFGTVDIDDDKGMALARELEVLDDGIPSVRLYKQPRDSAGELMWAGWEVPTLEFLLAQFEEHTAGAARNGKQLLKTQSAHTEDL
mmetsp:Transcript_15320/g.42844  ORF Transcript_15320/g.42844 Transcript_15320/m.42844 type:complete len:165 (-) Transcript_15320:216-710(-)|eukprot:CAMPEP_0117672958 /NCGR_PEP_ID=MMETSP0804-20121206/14205_1 /TAXON_ID=1074897 /ORGANISM="Tetraselmis astigmatica, Strain CCMP880" /LENGTH=164 /DNA_ID=CAMNT_0005481641 /DNA_START=80 /DNA_END=574 /DNA_ORIENTATION=+